MPSSINETESHNSKPNLPMWKRVIYLLAEAVLFIILLFYFVLQKEGMDFGFIPLLLIAGGLIFFHHKNFLRKKKKYHSFRFGSKEIEEPEKDHTATVEKSFSKTGFQSGIAPFLHRKRKSLLVVLILSFIAFGVFWAWDYHNQAQKREVACLEFIHSQYRGGDSYVIKLEGNYRIFKTQEEAMNYCLKVIKP